jgi:YggT family protein
MGIVRFILNLYIWVIIIDAILSYFPNYKVKKIPGYDYLRKAAELTLGPVRKLLSPDLPLDISPLIVILIISVLKAVW